jgi:hypothetical protein
MSHDAAPAGFMEKSRELRRKVYEVNRKQILEGPSSDPQGGDALLRS